MASTERGEKRSADHLEPKEPSEEVLGKILWGELCSGNVVRDIVEKEVEETGSLLGHRGFFIIGYSSDGYVKVPTPSWPTYADLWQATTQHPGETVEFNVDTRTGLFWPTKKEIAKRAGVFVQIALDEQKKYGLSRNKQAPTSTEHDAIIVSDSAQQMPRFDFFDSLAHVARQRSMQETHALRMENHRHAVKVQGLKSKLVEEKQTRRQAVKGAETAYGEIRRLRDEIQKLRADNESMCDLKRDYIMLVDENKELETKNSSLQKKVDGMTAILRDD